jgi:hypothetical protein
MSVTVWCSIRACSAAFARFWPAFVRALAASLWHSGHPVLLIVR